MSSTDVLCSYGGFSNVTGITNAATGSPYTVQEMFIEVMAPAATITPLPAGAAHHNDTSSTPLWPLTPFVQPIW